MGRSSYRPWAASFLVVGLWGCPIVDLSIDAGTPDAGFIDEACISEPTPDSGVVLTDCNPADGTRCNIAAFQACVWNVLTDEGQCACSSERLPPGGQCDLNRQNCEPGSTCLYFAQDPTPTCQPVCRLSDNTGCEAVQANAPDNAIACAPVRRGPDQAATTQFGVCFNVGVACDPLLDQCPASEKCSLLGRVTACTQAGTTAPGQECTSEPCARGTLCVALADAMGNEVPPTCYQPCNIGSPACATGTCFSVGLDFGLCL